MIKIESLTKIWPGITALDKVSFEVRQGSIHGFLGPNGAGKSTTMNIITGLIPPTSGRVFIKNHDVCKERKSVLGLVGFLPEHAPLYDNMNVLEYLKFVASINMVPSREIKKNVDEIIHSCGLLKVFSRTIGNLSKGFRQRVALAQTLVHSPELVILDEPTVGLDPNSVIEIRNLIKSLAGGRTVLFSSHTLHEVDLLCDDITIIGNGRIMRSGNKKKIINDFQTGQVVVADVKKWNDAMATEVKLNMSVERVEYVRKNDHYVVKFFSGKDVDIRHQISKYLVECEADLLSLTEERPGLEDIFQKVTVDE
ncbi:MAG: ABC transporter ATP-binding protein [Bacteriovoracaceae bacterium]|nr:ABC transporter ATP-binding protein [Bacteriovoracaceae bacterium]